MNKLNFNTGGHPLALDDLDFLQNALRGAIGAIANENAILTGLRLTSPSAGILDLSAGFVSIGGEVYEFAGEPFYQSFTDPVLVPYEATDTTLGLSPVVYNDSSNQDVHKKRMVRVEELASQSVKYRVSELADYADVWHEVNDTADIVGGFKAGTIWTTVGGTSLDELKVRKRGRYIEMTGAIKTTAFVDNDIVCVLPSVSKHNSYRPSKDHIFPVSAVDNNASGLPNHTSHLFIESNGNVRICKGTYTGSTDLTVAIDVRFEL